MGRFNVSQPRNQVKGGATFPASGSASQTATAKNPEGRTAWTLDAKTELFFRATSFFAGQDSFYEKAAKRDERLIELTRELAMKDWDWTSKFLVWLRSEGNMRTAPIMLAVEAVRERIKNGRHGDVTSGMPHRVLISSVLQRADEPGEMMAYWKNVVTGPMPKPIKRGIGDAAKRLYNERNFLRYNGESKAIGFGGVAELAQMPKTHGWQADLIRYAIGLQHHRDDPVPDGLVSILCRAELNKLTHNQRQDYARRVLDGEMGMTDLSAAMAGQWEWLLSWLGTSNKVTAKERWTLAAPHMGIMAAVRNLRNLDEAGFRIGDPIVDNLIAKLTNEDQIKRSRMFPFRFFTAYSELNSVTWAAALEVAAQHSLANIPVMSGRTLVLVDTSASMSSARLSGKSNMSVAKVAAFFGCALKIANPDHVDLWGFADRQFRADATRGHSLLRCAEEFAGKIGYVGHGTAMETAIRNTYDKHDRVIIISDMVAFARDAPWHQKDWFRRGGLVGDVAAAVPAKVPVYGFNLAAGSTTPLGQGNRHTLGGFTDATFKLVPQLEGVVGKGSWPWE